MAIFHCYVSSPEGISYNEVAGSQPVPPRRQETWRASNFGVAKMAALNEPRQRRSTRIPGVSHGRCHSRYDDFLVFSIRKDHQEEEEEEGEEEEEDHVVIVNIINIIMIINIIIYIYSHNHNHIHAMSSVPSTGHPCFSSPLPCSCIRTGDRTHQNGIQRISPQKKSLIVIYQQNWDVTSKHMGVW